MSERECIQLGLTCGILSGQASEIRQNMSACYDVHLRKKRAMESKTSALRSKLAALQEQKAILDAKLEPVVYGQEMLNHIINKHLNISELPLKIHIKINTGMNRLGFEINDFIK